MKTLHRNKKGEYARIGFIARVKRFIFRKIIVPTLIVGLPAAGYMVWQYESFIELHGLTSTVEVLAGDTNEAAEILAQRLLTEKLETLQYEIVNSLAAECETKGKKDPDSVIIFDSNEEPSIGAWQYQRDTVVTYYKKFYGQAITRTEAIQIAIDHDKARELTRKILFEEKGVRLGGGWGNWTNCSLKLGLPEQIDLLNRLSVN